MDLESKTAVILLPSYQPENTLIILSKALAELGFPILIVDDGSGKQYSSIFETCKQWSKVISYPKNKGKGFALKTGFAYIKENYKDCDFIVTADGDGQHRIQDIVRVYNCAKEKEITVIAERKFDVPTPIKSRIGNSISRFTQALCTFRYMKDNQCGLRAFSISLIPQLIKIGGSRYEYEMRVLTYLQTKELPYACISVLTIYEDGNKSSHFRPIKDTLLIQSSIFLYGLINLFTFFIAMFIATFFYYFLFKDGAVASNKISYELAVVCASPLSLLFHVVINLIVFKPKYPAKTIFRLVLYELIMLISEAITVSFFCRLCNFTIFGAYLLCLPLILFPLYYLIKGVGLVYNSQYE